MKREREIDIAKGIAILLVVIGHSYSSQDIVRQLINAFHMPFFFIASGILYRLQYIKSGRKTFNCSNKFKSLVVPWLIWGNCYQLFLCILKIIGGTSMSEAIAIFGGQLIRLGFGPMWFLPALFIASALFLATLQNTKLRKR